MFFENGSTARHKTFKTYLNISKQRIERDPGTRLGHTLCLPADYALGKCLTHIIVQGTATVSSEPSIVYHPIPELLHHLNYARAVSDSLY